MAKLKIKRPRTLLIRAKSTQGDQSEVVGMLLMCLLKGVRSQGFPEQAIKTRALAKSFNQLARKVKASVCQATPSVGVAKNSRLTRVPKNIFLLSPLLTGTKYVLQQPATNLMREISCLGH